LCFLCSTLKNQKNQHYENILTRLKEQVGQKKGPREEDSLILSFSPCF
jgi:hypothetical protein